MECDFIDLLYKYIINFWLNWNIRKELASFIFELNIALNIEDNYLYFLFFYSIERIKCRL